MFIRTGCTLEAGGHFAGLQIDMDFVQKNCKIPIDHEYCQCLFVKFIIEAIKSVAEIHKCFKSGVYDVKNEKVATILDCFHYRVYELLETEKCFITSDNPIIFTWIENAPDEIKIYRLGLLANFSTLIFPISSKLCLVGYLHPSFPKDGKYKDYRLIDSEETRKINNIISRNSHEFILAKNKKVLEGVGKKDFQPQVLEFLT